LAETRAPSPTFKILKGFNGVWLNPFLNRCPQFPPSSTQCQKVSDPFPNQNPGHFCQIGPGGPTMFLAPGFAGQLAAGGGPLGPWGPPPWPIPDVVPKKNGQKKALPPKRSYLNPWAPTSKSPIRKAWFCRARVLGPKYCPPPPGPQGRQNPRWFKLKNLSPGPRVMALAQPFFSFFFGRPWTPLLGRKKGAPKSISAKLPKRPQPTVMYWAFYSLVPFLPGFPEVFAGGYFAPKTPKTGPPAQFFFLTRLAPLPPPP